MDEYPQCAPGSIEAFAQMLPTAGESGGCVIKLHGASVRSRPRSLLSLNHSLSVQTQAKMHHSNHETPRAFFPQTRFGVSNCSHLYREVWCPGLLLESSEHTHYRPLLLASLASFQVTRLAVGGFCFDFDCTSRHPKAEQHKAMKLLALSC